ncbi:MAG: YraN family protein [Pseudomonadales bacterium]|nr:YraN family protein [Pseudomonadales bacterium]
MDGKKSSIETGAAIEKIALRYLMARGLKKLDQNYRCQLGEIDLVMTDRKTVVFVEVRYRSYSQFGGGAASVTNSKQRKLIRAAKYYMQQKNIGAACRFDVIDVCATGTIKHQDNPAAKHQDNPLTTGAGKLVQKTTHKPLGVTAVKVTEAEENYSINWIESAFLAIDW